MDHYAEGMVKFMGLTIWRDASENDSTKQLSVN